MARKKKEKVQTLEEIKEGLRKNTASRWLRGELHFGLVPTPTGLQFLPLTEPAENQTLLIFMIDPADYTLDLLYDLMDSWRNRYRKLKWLPIFALQQKYPFMKTGLFFDKFKAHPCFPNLATYLDPFGELFEKYGSQREPVVALFHKGELRFSESLLGNFSEKITELENQLQLALRQDDPGIPLPLILPYVFKGITDSGSFIPAEITRAGRWLDSKTSLTTDDQQATLSAQINSNCVRLVCLLHALARKTCRVHVTLNGEPLPKPLHGENVRMDEKGNCLVEVDRLNGMYEIISAPDAIKGELKFHFVSVIENPIIFYELRMGMQQKDSA